jgi:ribose transport system permease protein
VSTDTRPAIEPAASRPLRERLRLPGAGGSTAGIWAVLAVVFVISWILVEINGGNFLTVTNVRNMLVRSVSLGIVAVGQTLVILAGSLDLSVAYLISVTAVLSGYIMAGDPARIPLGVGVVLAVGALVGLTNGLLVTKLKAHPFIATLGTALIMRGALSARFSSFAGEVPREFQQLGYGLIGPVPVSVLLMLSVVGAAWWMLQRTTFGGHLYAVGGSEEVARLSGVRTDRTLIGAHVLCSLTAVLTGLYIVARLGSGAPWVGPDGGYDLESIAAVVVGGTALAGGRGGVAGTLAGVLILAVLDNLFNQLQVDSFLKQVIRGVIIVAAVASYALRAKGEADA